MAKKERPQVTATAVMSFPQPPLRKAEEYLKAYTSYTFTAISAIAQEVGSVQLKLFEKKFVKGKPEAAMLYEHEVLSLLHYANPLVTFYDLVEATQIYLELTGEAFWVILKEKGVPREMWLIRPDWVKIVPDPVEIIKHYVYHPGGVYNEKVIIPKENMIPFKYFNPLNPYRGKGSVQAAALPIDIHTFAQEWNRNFFFNSAIPGLVFTTEKKLNEKVIKRFLNQWQASYGGRAKSNKIAFIGGGLKLDKTTMGAKEMDFATQQKMMRDDVLAVFKVPKTILGMTDAVNYANANATTRAFMERVITPRMRKFVGTLNEFLIPMYKGAENLFLDFVDPAPEDVEIKLKKYANARRYTWLTPNEIRAEENLEPIEGGDDLFAPLAGGAPGAGSTQEETGAELEGAKGLKGIFSKKSKEKKAPIKKVKPKTRGKERPFKHMMQIPPIRVEELTRRKLEESLTGDLTRLVGAMLEAKNGKAIEKVGVNEKKPVKKEDTVFTEEAKDAYWRTFIDMVTEREDELKERVIELFKEQEKLILERLNKDVRYWRKDARVGKAASVIPSVEELSKIWNVVFLELIREIVIEQGNYVLDFLGAGGNLEVTTDPAVEYLREHGAELIREINETTREKLRETLAEGFEAGESVPDLATRVEDVFKDATRNRAEMIARTESLRASNFGSVEAYRQSGVVEAEEWLTAKNDRVCPFCLEMEGKVIGLDESFFDKGDSLTVGGNTLKFDMLAVEYPPLHPNSYDEKTELFTIGGWKKVGDVLEGEKCLSLNPGTFDLEYRDVVKTYKHKPSWMIEMSNRNFDLMVTEDHNVFYQTDWNSKHNKKKWKFVKAKELVGKRAGRFYRSSEWRGENSDTVALGDKEVPFVLYAKFMGWYLSEGSCVKSSNKRVHIAQSKTKNYEKWEMIRELLDEIGFKFYEGSTQFQIVNLQLCSYLKQFGKCNEKYVPENIKNATPEIIKAFLETYRLGDGSIRKRNKKEWKEGNFREEIVYFTTSKRLADDVGELILKVGRRPSYYLQKHKGIKVKHKNGEYVGNYDVWAIRECYSKHSYVDNLEIKKVKYDKYAYCVDIDKYHTLLVRRNGKVCWSGNCRCTTIPVLLGERSSKPLKAKEKKPVKKKAKKKT